MKQLTINIPDHSYKAFMEYFNRIPEATVLNETSSFILEQKHLDILDRRQKMGVENCLTREESNSKLKEKYGL